MADLALYGDIRYRTLEGILSVSYRNDEPWGHMALFSRYLSGVSVLNGTSV